MRTEIDDLLNEAADDSAQPLNHSIDDIIRRGRRGARLRRTGVVAASALTAAAVVTAVSLWPGSGDGIRPSGIQPAGTPGVTVTLDVKTGKVLQPPASKLTAAQIIAKCLKQDTDRIPNKAGGGSDPIGDWTVKITQGQGTWFRAILESPDGKRRARCQHNETRNVTPYDSFDREAKGLLRPYEVWSDRDGSWGEVPKNVARVTFDYEGMKSDALVKNGYYVWYAELPYTEVKGKPIWAIFYDAKGKELARFDSNPSNPEVQNPPCAADSQSCSLTGTAKRDPIFPK